MGHLRALEGSEEDEFGRLSVFGLFESPINGTETDMLWAAAGQASPTGAVLFVVFRTLQSFKSHLETHLTANLLVFRTHDNLLVRFSVGSYLVFPVYYLVAHNLFQVRTIRSDLIFGVMFGLFFPSWTLISGSLSDEDGYAVMRVVSLSIAACGILSVKYIMPAPNRLVNGVRMSFVYSQIGHGILIIGMLQSVIWEAFKLEEETYNYINAACGGVLALTVMAYAKRYGLGVIEKGDTGRQLQSNLSPLFIIAFSLWQIEYNAAYQPDLAFYFIYTSVVVPLAAAFSGYADWFEFRIVALLHVTCLRLVPVDFSSPTNVVVFFGVETLQSASFRYTFAILTAIATLAVCAEVLLRINVSKPQFMLFGLGSLVKLDNRHPEVFYRDGDDDITDARIKASDL